MSRIRKGLLRLIALILSIALVIPGVTQGGYLVNAQSEPQSWNIRFQSQESAVSDGWLANSGEAYGSHSIALVNRKPDGGVISQYAYTYDEAGQQISKADSYGTTTYAYDKVGRVYRVDAPGKTTFYAYDDAGNRQSLQETYEYRIK